MKHLLITSGLLSILVLLCSCGGGRASVTPPTTVPPSGTQPPQGSNIPGDWEFATRSTVGMPALAIGGSIIQSGSTLSSTLHVDGSSCFGQPTAIHLTGTLADGNISLTSESVNGQVISLAGTITNKDGYPYQLTGTYTIDGGCATGDQGKVTGYSVDGINGLWYGNLTTAGGADIHWGTDQLGQVVASSEGSIGLTGNFNFDGSCFSSGKLTPGMFPTPSFILGTSVALYIPTGNGTVAFVGTADPDGLIRGTYTVTGGSCESTGTGYLSPWEY
jgi:hypothetical protein